MNTLYNRLLAAGPMRAFVKEPFLFADFYSSQQGIPMEKKKKKANLDTKQKPVYRLK